MRGFADDRHNAIQVRHHVIVRKSKDRKALRRQPGITSLIEALTRGEIVRFTIEFNNEASLMTDKIRNVTADWDLPTYTKAIDTMSL